MSIPSIRGIYHGFGAWVLSHLGPQRKGPSENIRDKSLQLRRGHIECFHAYMQGSESRVRRHDSSNYDALRKIETDPTIEKGRRPASNPLNWGNKTILWCYFGLRFGQATIIWTYMFHVFSRACFPLMSGMIGSDAPSWPHSTSWH
jgi:hypothetical protein